MYDIGEINQRPNDAGFEPTRLNSNISLKEVYAAVFRARYIIGGIVLSCLALGVAFTVITTRQYEGVATVEVREEAEKVLGTEADRETSATKVDVERFLDTQIDLVRSRQVAISVADRLNLFNQQFLDRMKVTKVPEADGILTEKEAIRELVIKTLLKNVQVEYTGQTRILVIRFFSPEPRLSADVANSFATTFISSNLRRKSASSSYALEFLQQQLNEAQIRLEQSERDALEYARRTRIVDVSNAPRATGSENSSQPQSLITAQLIQLNQAYSAAVAARIELEQRWERTEKLPILRIPEVLNNPAVQGLLEQRATLESDYRQQLETRQEDFPTVRQAAARLKEIDRQLAALSQNIRGSVQGQYQIALNQELRLQKQLDQLKGTTLVEQNQGIQLSILKRAAETNRQQYESLLKRFNQLNAESGVQANNLNVIDRAVPQSKPSWPNTPLNIAFSVIAGIFLAALWIIAQIQFFDRVRTPSDVNEGLGLPLLGAVPIAMAPVEELADQKSGISEAFNLIRSSLTMSSQGGAPKTVMITSTQASEGKTSCCVSLGVVFSRIGKKVLIIDFDLRRPNIHRTLGLSNTNGISSVLAGQLELEQVIQKSDYKDVDVITSGPIPPSPTDLLTGIQLREIVSHLADKYDLVLLDAPPMLAMADAEILSVVTEKVVVVIESGRNSRASVKNVIMRLAKTGAHIGGVVLTKYNPVQLGYGYADEYAYGYKYEQQDEKAS